MWTGVREEHEGKWVVLCNEEKQQMSDVECKAVAVKSHDYDHRLLFWSCLESEYSGQICTKKTTFYYANVYYVEALLSVGLDKLHICPKTSYFCRTRCFQESEKVSSNLLWKPISGRTGSHPPHSHKVTKAFNTSGTTAFDALEVRLSFYLSGFRTYAESKPWNLPFGWFTIPPCSTTGFFESLRKCVASQSSINAASGLSWHPAATLPQSRSYHGIHYIWNDAYRKQLLRFTRASTSNGSWRTNRNSRSQQVLK